MVKSPNHHKSWPKWEQPTPPAKKITQPSHNDLEMSAPQRTEWPWRGVSENPFTCAISKHQFVCVSNIIELDWNLILDFFHDIVDWWKFFGCTPWCVWENLAFWALSVSRVWCASVCVCVFCKNVPKISPRNVEWLQTIAPHQLDEHKRAHQPQPMYLNQIHAKMHHVVAEYDVHGMCAKSTGPLHGQKRKFGADLLTTTGLTKALVWWKVVRIWNFHAKPALKLCIFVWGQDVAANTCWGAPSLTIKDKTGVEAVQTNTSKRTPHRVVWLGNMRFCLCQIWISNPERLRIVLFVKLGTLSCFCGWKKSRRQVYVGPCPTKSERVSLWGLPGICLAKSGKQRRNMANEKKCWSMAISPNGDFTKHFVNPALRVDITTGALIVHVHQPCL